MIPLYEDPCFTFRFADDRIVPRFHLEGVEAGRRVSVFWIDPVTNERLGLLATAIVAWTGNIYAGLWYPTIIALITVVIGFLFLKDTKDVDIAKT